MTELPAVLTRFTLAIGELDPDFVTDQIGIRPSKVLRKGESRRSPRPPVAESSWEVECMRRKMYSIDESIAETLAIVWPRRKEIVTLCQTQRLECLFVTAVWADDEHRPIYELSSETLKKMSELKASWIMDLV